VNDHLRSLSWPWYARLGQARQVRHCTVCEAVLLRRRAPSANHLDASIPRAGQALTVAAFTVAGRKRETCSRLCAPQGAVRRPESRSNTGIRTGRPATAHADDRRSDDPWQGGRLLRLLKWAARGRLPIHFLRSRPRKPASAEPAGAIAAFVSPVFQPVMSQSIQPSSESTVKRTRRVLLEGAKGASLPATTMDSGCQADRGRGYHGRRTPSHLVRTTHGRGQAEGPSLVPAEADGAHVRLTTTPTSPRRVTPVFSLRLEARRPDSRTAGGGTRANI
jgi:hypothetical protein